MSTHSFKVHEYVAHTTEVMSMAISPKTGQVLATGGEDCKVNIWEVKSAGNIRSLGSNKAGVESLCFDPDDTIVVSGSSSGALKVFDLNEGRLSRNLVGHKTNITSLQYHPISEYVVSGSKDCNVKVWDVRNKECLSTYTGHEKEVTCVRFSPDGRWVASSAKDGTVLIWDMVAGKHLQSLKMKGPSFVTAFEFNPSEFLLAAVTNSRAVRVWNLETMEVCYTAPPEQSTIRSLAFAPGGGGGGSSSSNRQVLCTSTKDAVKSWTWADTATSHTGEYADGDNSGSRSLTLAGCMPMGPEGVAVSALRVSKSGNVTGAACVSNFVSIYRTSLADMAAAQQEAVGARAMTRQQHGSGGGSDGSKASGYNNGSSSSSSSSSVGGDSRPPFVLYGNPGGGGAQSPTTTQKQSQQQAARSMSGGGSSSNSSGGGGGDADRIRADRERNGGARERVVDRQEDWSAAEPKHPSSPSSQGAGGGGRRGYKSVSPSVPSAAAAAVDTPPRYQHQHQYKASMMDEEDACRAAGAGAAAAGAAAAAGGGGRPPAHLFAPSPEGGSEAKNSGGGYPGKSSCSSAGQQQHENDGGYKMQSTPPRHHEDKQHQHQMELHKLMPINGDSRFERVNSPVDVGMATGAGAGAMGSPSSSSSSVLTRTGALRELGAAVAGPAGGERATHHDHHHHHEESQSRPRSAAAALNSPTKHAGSGGGGGGSGTAVRARLGSGGPSSSNSIIINNSNSSSLAAADPAAALDGVLASSRAFASALSKRLVDVRVLRKFWNRGDLEDVIDHLETIQGAAHHDALHLVVLADFFGSVQLRGNGLCLDSCLRLMPLLEAMLAYAQKGAELGGSGSLAPASGHVVASAVNAFSSLVAAFGDLIKDTCTTHETSAHAGVDLSREARFKKCKVCLEVMRGVRKRVPALKGQFDGDGAMQQRLLDFQNTLVKAM